MTEKKRYEVKGRCPQCACGSIYHLTVEEIEAKTIDKENMELTCPECGGVHREQIKSVDRICKGVPSLGGMSAVQIIKRTVSSNCGLFLRSKSLGFVEARVEPCS